MNKKLEKSVHQQMFEYNKEIYRDLIAKNSIRLIGEFLNEYGEFYEVYSVKGFERAIFVTGDELDWEIGWKYEGYNSTLIQSFTLSNEERNRIDGVIKSFSEEDKI